MGAEVTVISTSDSKAADAKRLGAAHFINSKDPAQMATIANTFHFILNTVSAPHSYDSLLPLLRTDGAMVLVGAPPMPSQVTGFNLIMQRKTLAGSLIGGIRETQEMLDYCAEKNIVSDVELISIQEINAAYDRMTKNDVRYRFVIDLKSLG
jgi:uncharacterized zinc-type alcohol dehydrogenase-like protein